MDLIPITDEDTEENAFKLSVVALIKYGTNRAFLDKHGRPLSHRGHEALVFANIFISQIELGIGLGFLDLTENHELRDFVTEIETFAKRYIGERANVPTLYISGELVPLPIKDFLHEEFRFNQEIFDRFPLLRSTLEKISLLPFVNSMVPIIHQLINSRLDDIDEENQPMFESSLKSIALLGPSGVGKTEIAENLVSVLYALEIVKAEKITSYHPDAEVQTGPGNTEARMKKLISERQAAGGVFFVDDVHRAHEGLIRDLTYGYKANAVNLLMGELKNLQKENVFVIFAGTKNKTTELFNTIETSDAQVYFIDIKPPSIDELVTYVAAHMAHRKIKMHSTFKADLHDAFVKLRSTNEKFGNWKVARTVVAELRKLSKGNRLFGNVPEQQIVDGPILAQMYKNLFEFDDEYLVEVASHGLTVTPAAEPEAFDVFVDRGVAAVEEFLHTEAPEF